MKTDSPIHTAIQFSIPADYQPPACGHATRFITSPSIDFRGEQLFLWGITRKTRIVRLMAANVTILPISPEPVTGMLYHTEVPFDLLDDVLTSDEFAPDLRQSLTFPTISPANTLQLEIEGPVTHAAIIGWGYRNWP
jgi:hypothetical protein